MSRSPAVPFRAVRAIGDELVRVPKPDADFDTRLRRVLDFYGVAWSDDQGTTLVTEELAADLDTCWNFTTKADDPEWLAGHPAPTR